ncbi:MAG TPA: hypothetical protein VEK11_20160 [Thermoanaerobaculia bacterium]|nr:hypothetical protein [Thermoanaerobaculia bacterium]
MVELSEVCFRSSPLIELKTLAELPPEQQEPFRDLERDADFHGLLVPRLPSAVNIKSVGRETAALFRGLASPSRIDPALLENSEVREDLIDLVLDGIFEVESSGAFVSGADAFPILCTLPHATAAATAVARLSREALLYAQDLETDVPQILTSAVYFYNRIPISRFWRSRFPDRDAVSAYLGIDRGSLRTLLDQHWHPAPVEKSNGWLTWYSRTPRQHSGGDVTFKLYVSPRPEHVRDAFEGVVRALASFPGSQMKIGQDAAGLLRSDKLVAYFYSREELDEAAQAVQRELAGCPAQGVPFTAGVDADGLLSWGVDPPDSSRALRWLGRESWRLWLAQKIGSALAVARQARGTTVEPWLFAVERVRRLGVDVDSWTPTASLWSAS